MEMETATMETENMEQNEIPAMTISDFMHNIDWNHATEDDVKMFLNNFDWTTADIEVKTKFVNYIFLTIVQSIQRQDAIVKVGLKQSFYDEFVGLWNAVDMGPYEEIKTKLDIQAVPDDKIKGFELIPQSQIEADWLYTWAQKKGILVGIQEDQAPVRIMPADLKLLYLISLADRAKPRVVEAVAGGLGPIIPR